MSIPINGTTNTTFDPLPSGAAHGNVKLNLNDAHGYMPEYPSDKNQDEIWPMCFLNIHNKAFCIPMEVSILVFAALGIVFFYQIFFVWIRMYNYEFLKE